MKRFEADYAKWFKFVRSHSKGRYSSKVGEAGTQASENSNSGEENPIAASYWYARKHSKVAPSPNFERYGHDGRIGGPYTKERWSSAFKNGRKMFMNINDDLPFGNGSDYVEGHKVMLEALETAFPPI